MSRKTKLKKNCLCQRYICFINKVWFNYSVPVPYQNCGCKQFIIVVDGYPGVIMRCCHVISCVLQPPFGPPGPPPDLFARCGRNCPRVAPTAYPSDWLQKKTKLTTFPPPNPVKPDLLLQVPNYHKSYIINRDKN